MSKESVQEAAGTMHFDSGRPPSRRASCWIRAFSLLVGLFLFATAGLKLNSPRDMVALGAVYKIPWWVTSVVVQAEVFTACFLLFRVNPRLTLRVVAGLFAGFAVFSAYRACAGYESCGCFGSVKIHPLWTLTLDACLAGVALFASQQAPSEVFSVADLSRPLLLYALLGVAAATWTTFQAHDEIVPADGFEEGSFVVLEPDKWIGEPPPVAEQVEPAVDFSSGSWVLLFFHHDCPDCQTALPKYDELADPSAGRRGARVLLVEVPPFGSVPFAAKHAGYARLLDAVDWFMQTPVEVNVEQGIVTSSSLKLPAIEPQETTE